MPILSPARENWPVLEGLSPIHRGKVRDTYDLGDGYLLVVATNAISIFDFVLNAMVSNKGRVLSAMTHFWMNLLAQQTFCKTHLVAAGSEIDPYLPQNLQGNSDLQSRALVVMQLEMIPIEWIFRFCLTGSGLRSYLAGQTVCGHYLPDGIQDGDMLPDIIDTPTTKADQGHDKPILFQQTRDEYPHVYTAARAAVSFASKCCYLKGIILADTKLEFGRAPMGNLCLGDEVFTPDSSRFWNRREWEEGRKPARRISPFPLDKQFMRLWGITEGIDELDPSDSQHVALVHAMEVPEQFLAQTTSIYEEIFRRITGKRLNDYLAQELGVSV